MIFFKKSPVQPGNLIVLTIAVVIAVFCISKFISCKKHGSSSAAQKNGAGVSDHAVTERKNFRIIRFPFCAAVPASVVIGSVCIIPSVVFIVLVIIGVEIIQSKAIVAGKKIDAGVISGIISLRRIVIAPVEIAGPGNAPGGIPGIPAVSF